MMALALGYGLRKIRVSVQALISLCLILVDDSDGVMQKGLQSN